MTHPRRTEPAPDVARRFARWQRTLDPEALWPGVPERTFQAAATEIAQVAARLVSDGAATARLERPAPATPRAVGVAAFAAGMGPLLGHWIERGRLETEREVGDLLRTHLDHGRRRALRLDAELRRVLDALTRHGIPAVVLKGLHTGWVYFPEPGVRPCADIDLLIPPEQAAAADEAIRALGFREGSQAGRPHRTEWLGPGAPLLPPSLEMEHEDNPWSVDLHVSLDRRLCSGLVAGLGAPAPQTAALLERAEGSIRVLPQPLLLAELAFHTSSHFEIVPLIRLVELVLVMRRDYGAAEDWHAFCALVAEKGLARFVYPALALAERFIPGTLPAHVHSWLGQQAPWLMRRAVGRTRPATAQQLHRPSLDVRLMWSTSLKQWVGCVADRLWPRDERGRVPPGTVLKLLPRLLRKLRHGTFSVRRPD